MAAAAALPSTLPPPRPTIRNLPSRPTGPGWWRDYNFFYSEIQGPIYNFIFRYLTGELRNYNSITDQIQIRIRPQIKYRGADITLTKYENELFPRCKDHSREIPPDSLRCCANCISYSEFPYYGIRCELPRIPGRVHCEGHLVLCASWEQIIHSYDNIINSFNPTIRELVRLVSPYIPDRPSRDIYYLNNEIFQQLEARPQDLNRIFQQFRQDLAAFERRENFPRLTGFAIAYFTITYELLIRLLQYDTCYHYAGCSDRNHIIRLAIIYVLVQMLGQLTGIYLTDHPAVGSLRLRLRIIDTLAFMIDLLSLPANRAFLRETPQMDLQELINLANSRDYERFPELSSRYRLLYNLLTQIKEFLAWGIL